MKERVLVAVLTIVLLSMGVTATAQNHMGVGVKLLAGKVPFVIGNIKSETIGLEGGIGLTSYGVSGVNVSLLWYQANGKLYFSGSKFPLAPYIGVGLVGVTASATYLGVTASASVLGFDGLGGLEFSALQYGIPIVLFAGIDYMYTWMSLGELQQYGFSASGFSWHIGVRVDF